MEWFREPTPRAVEPDFKTLLKNPPPNPRDAEMIRKATSEVRGLVVVLVLMVLVLMVLVLMVMVHMMLMVVMLMLLVLVVPVL